MIWFLLGCPRNEPLPPGDDDDDDDVVVPTDACDEQPDGSFCSGAVAIDCVGGEVTGSESCDQACVDGACVGCAALTVDFDDGTHVVVDADPHDAVDVWRLRPIHVTGGATLSTTGPFRVVDIDGNDVSGAVSDATVFLRATAVGDGTLTTSPLDGCTGDPASFVVHGVLLPRLAGTTMATAPGFDDGEDMFLGGREMWVDVPLFAAADRDGDAFDAWLVPHTDAGFTGDLDNAGGVGPFAGAVGSPASLGSAPSDSPYAVWDVVVDFDRDGTLSPGDLARGLAGAPIVTAGNLAAPGPLTTRQADVDWGGNFLQQRVYWPEDVGSLDPLTLVVISHGNGHDYRWYDYLGLHLASHGYVVMSHHNNTEPGPVAASRTTVSNTDAFLQGLPQFQGGVLDGEVDVHSIVWVGHSRGGEGVVLAWRDLRDGSQTAQNFDETDVVLISSIAPTLFEGPQQADPGPTPYHLLSGAADGDVTGGVEQDLTQYFRMFQGAEAERMVSYVQGADHNDFNCCGTNDSVFQNGQPLIGRPAAQVVARSVYLALLDGTLRGRPELLELFSRSQNLTQPFGPTIRLSTVYLPDRGAPRVVDDFQTQPQPTVGSSGADVTGSVRDAAEGSLDDGNFNLTVQASDPMNGMTWSHGNDTRPDRGAVFGWLRGDDVDLTYHLVAADRDVSDWDAVSLRAAQSTRDPANDPTADVTFTVELEDGAGVTSAVPTAGFGGIPWPFDRGGSGNGRGWVNEFQTVRIPLTAFVRVEPTLDLTDIRAVRLRFGAAHGSAQGRIGLDDLQFEQELP